MDRDLWSGLAVFAAIVEAGSFARAATRLGLSASALSHAMRTLEAKLGTRLLDRTTRSLAPTQAGADLLLSLRPAMAAVDDALGALDSTRARPTGRVRVNAHRPAAMHVVLPRLPGFAAAYPDVAVELVVDDGLVDIVAGRFDCGVRHEGEVQRDMISVRISDAFPSPSWPPPPTWRQGRRRRRPTISAGIAASATATPRPGRSTSGSSRRTNTVSPAPCRARSSPTTST
ncbi:hypothetical protein DA075_02460 [Methylobacterium currus]|uniref:HTH lysR-type domain-containing protein n=1 Tax=Methylobacterium currus TaxID=2051553 RepID=A0A2R4WEH1_9HYPH|nr:hypothetical protein DA075_02460 [Methylobacterium currus]